MPIGVFSVVPNQMGRMVTHLEHVKTLEEREKI